MQLWSQAQSDIPMRLHAEDDVFRSLKAFKYKNHVKPFESQVRARVRQFSAEEDQYEANLEPESPS